MKRTIGILFHEADSHRPWRYVILQFAEFWRDQGHRVELIYGVERFVPADILIVHVDLSVVPEAYLRFARRYPITVNGEVQDIRKSTYSTLLVRPGDGYDGQVIVKSDLNYAGVPELLRGLRTRATAAGSPGATPGAPVFRSPADYRIFDRPEAVPASWYANPDLVVERFVPEREKGLYYLRHLHFLGDRTTCIRLESEQPIVNASGMRRIEPIEPHPAIVELKERMRFQYGKLDYVVHQGQAILLDANKTTGGGTGKHTPSLIAGRRYRAEGIHSFFAG